MNKSRAKVTGTVELEKPYRNIRFESAYEKLVQNVDRIPIEVIEEIVERYV